MHIAPQFSLIEATMTDTELHEQARVNTATAYAAIVAASHGERICYTRLHRSLQKAAAAALELERRQLSMSRQTTTPPQVV